jgi:hypothetical protein
MNSGDARHTRRDFLQQFQPFHADRDLIEGEAGHVATGARQARNVPVGERIGDLCKHNRDGSGHLLQSRQHCIVAGENDVRPDGRQLRRMGAKTTGVAGRPAVLDPQVATVRPAELLKSCAERPDRGCARRCVS